MRHDNLKSSTPGGGTVMSQPDQRIENEASAYGAPDINLQPEPEETARIGPAGRLAGVLLSPGETFEDINRKPTWLVPILVAMVIALAGTLFFNWRVNPDWDQVVRKQIREQVEKSGGQMPSEADMQRSITIGRTIAKFTPVIAVVFTPIVYLFLAGIFALGLMLMQVQTTFKKILSVVSWSNVAIGVVSTIVFAASLMVKDREGLSQIDPTKGPEFVPTNIGAFLPSDFSPVIKALAGSIDIFTIWLLILLSIGFAAIAGSKKVTATKTGALVFSLWGVYVLVKIGIAAIRG